MEVLVLGLDVVVVVCVDEDEPVKTVVVPDDAVDDDTELVGDPGVVLAVDAVVDVPVPTELDEVDETVPVDDDRVVDTVLVDAVVELRLVVGVDEVVLVADEQILES